MKKRSFPAVLRYHKFRPDTKYQEYFFSESLLYRPFNDEKQLEQELQDLQCKGQENLPIYEDRLPSLLDCQTLVTMGHHTLCTLLCEASG